MSGRFTMSTGSQVPGWCRITCVDCRWSRRCKVKRFDALSATHCCSMESR